MTSLTPRRLRILCLHGFMGSAQRMRRRVGALVTALEPYADLVFVSGPQDAYGGHAWWNADRSGGTMVYGGFDATKTYLSAVVREQGPFDGVLGFSQGAIVTSVLCGLRDSLFPFSFAIMVGGFSCRDRVIARCYDNRDMYDLPSLHVYGTNDDVVPPAGSRALAHRFKNPQIIVHDGGHTIPCQGIGIMDKWVQFIRDQQRPPSSRY